MARIANDLCAKYANATDMKSSADQYFIARASGISRVVRDAWEEEMIEAEKQRLSDRTVMDVLKARHVDNADRGTQLPRFGQAPNPVTSLAEEWIQLGLDIEERQ